MSGRGYHHGDLRNALLEATTELVRERGPRGFSVSEAARRLGVSSSAPYRHFQDRDAMLAATALRGFIEMEVWISRLPASRSLFDTASSISTNYLRFALDDPARFEVMFSHGIDKSQHEELLQQTVKVQEKFEALLGQYLPGAEVAGRAAELWAIAHGIASLAIGGNIQHVVPERQITELARSASRTWARGM